jgi:HPt (histidine-containing phosphotransfer) domain-containing protein
LISPVDPPPTEKFVVAIDPDLEAIVPGFLENRRHDVIALQAAIHSDDFKTVRMLGHRMKGDGGGYGFEVISTIGAALEQAAARQDRPSIKRLTTELEKFLGTVKVVYRR